MFKIWFFPAQQFLYLPVLLHFMINLKKELGYTFSTLFKNLLSILISTKHESSPAKFFVTFY